MMLTPAAPSAGTTGGAGLALPASSASLMIFVTFFAIIAGSGARCRCNTIGAAGRTATGISLRQASLLLLLLAAPRDAAIKLDEMSGRLSARASASRR